MENEDHNNILISQSSVLHWNYRGFTEFPLKQLKGDENEITDIYLKENLISSIPSEIGRLERLESLYLSGNDIAELPKEISMLKCLKCLDLSGNRLQTVPEEIGEIRNLKFFILDDNELTALPLRLSELRCLRYLSVCDNDLRWLPQRPVFNYHHCEFRFWRNALLKTIPYSLWYHMLRDQQTRSLNIGCLKVPQYQSLLRHGRCRLKFQHESRTWEVDVDCPPQYSNIQHENTPPSLYELCMRRFYQTLSETAKNLSHETCSVYCDNYMYDNVNNSIERDGDANNNIDAVQQQFQCFDITDRNIPLVNQRVIPINNDYSMRALPVNGYQLRRQRKYNYVAADVLKDCYGFLPYFLSQELSEGPVSRCENVKCKKPVFDYVSYEFCLGKIVLIDNIEDVILSAAFCSQACANVWKGGKTNTIIPWTLSPE